MKNNRNLSLIFGLFFVFSFFFNMAPVSAGAFLDNQEGIGKESSSNVGRRAFGQDSDVSLVEMIGFGIKIIFSLLGIYFLVIIIGAGFKMMSSDGDPKAFGAAKDRLVNATAGLLVIFIAYALTAYIVGLVTKLGRNGGGDTVNGINLEDNFGDGGKLR